MQNKKKIFSGVLSGALSLSMAAPALAATDTSAVIDYDRKATLNIHKIIENDGQLDEAYGLANPGENRVAVDNVGFDYVRIADIQNVSGIIISEEKADGTLAINYDADDGMTQVGTFYKLTDNNAFMELVESLGIYPTPTYIKSEVTNENNTLQYEWADEKANSVLTAEMTALNAAIEGFKTAKENLTNAEADQSKKQAAYDTSTTQKTNAADAAEAAGKALIAAQAAAAAAADAADNAQTALNSAGTALTSAETRLENAQDAYDAAVGNYSGNDTATIKKLQSAQEALDAAKAAEKKAQKANEKAKEAAAKAEKAAKGAKSAYDAAKEIKEAIDKANASAATGTPISETGMANAIKQAQSALDAASEYRAAAVEAQADAASAYAEAATALSEATTALSGAQSTLNSLKTANAEAYNDLKECFTELESAKSASQGASEAYATADAANTKAQSELTAANAARDAAQTAATKANAILAALTDTNTDNERELDDAKAKTGEMQAAYNDAYAALKNAENAFNAKAAENGIIKVYTAQALQKALEQILTKLSEEDVTEWVSKHAPTQNDTNSLSTRGQQAEGYTDDKGVLTFPNMELGLYLVAETDISYHDGKAGAWNDKTGGGFINNDQMNTYDRAGGTYSITPLDGHNRGIKHTYAAGEYYEESISPEAPVLESPAAPFLVSLPTTNMTDTVPNGYDGNEVAAGDNAGEAGTVWQYTVDVYPKNQSTAIYKRIVDPDEIENGETLRTSEDYQIGDTIQEMIWADAPVLQANQLNPDAGKNKHEAYVIVNRMSDGLTVKQNDITNVYILPKTALTEDGQTRMIYVDPEGTYITKDEFISKGLTETGTLRGTYYFGDDGLIYLDGDGSQAGKTHYTINTTTKYYEKVGDSNSREISKETFESRTGVTGNYRYYSDINNQGAEVGDTSNVYDARTDSSDKAGSKLTGQYWVERVSYKFQETSTSASALPLNADKFPSKTMTEEKDDEGHITSVSDVLNANAYAANVGDKTKDVKLLTLETDYTVEFADNGSIDEQKAITITDKEGNVNTVMEAGTHGFVIKLTPEGLNKLNARSVDSVVVVEFNATLNANAKLGQTPENMNYPELWWTNSNTSLRHVSGNRVYEYAYELVLQKKGVDGANMKDVHFVVSRTDAGDINANDGKDLTDTVSNITSYAQDDSMKFVKESDGVYHFYDSSSETADAVEKTALTINGLKTEYNTITPDSTGRLIIKGLDSNDYTFKEISTEAGKNLLASEFVVHLRAKDHEYDSLRTGALDTATVQSVAPQSIPESSKDSSIPVDITIGLEGHDDSDTMGENNKNLGIAGMSVTNNDVIDLRTGGTGRMMIYIIGAALLGGMAVGLYAKKRKEARENIS